MQATELWQERSRGFDAQSAAYNAADNHLTSGSGDSDGAQAESVVLLTRALNWVRALHAYEEFWVMHRRSPRENTRNRESLPAGERRMGEWARYQRRFRTRLCRYQSVRLDVSPAFEWDPQAAAWRDNLAASVRRIAATGMLPHHDASSPTDFALARWIARQLRQRQAGELLPERAAQLEHLLQFSRRTKK